MQKLIEMIKGIFRDAYSSSKELFKIMVPIIIIVKVLQEFGLIEYLAMPLKPLMGLIGLPAEMGLVWASAMINSFYGGFIVFISLAPDLSLTTAQATVITTIILIAHGLPIEASIASRSGAKLVFQCISRIAGAFTLGWILNTIYTTTNTLQEPVTILFQGEVQTGSQTLMEWGMSQALNMLTIFGIILGLIVMMRILHLLKIIDLINAVLRPTLKLISIGPKASAVTVIGLTLGLAYGGGLIINEAKSGNIDKKDIFYSLTLMGLSHSLIEDTLLALLLGAHISGVFWGRLAFSLVAMAILVQITKRLPDSFTNKYLWGNPA